MDYRYSYLISLLVCLAKPCLSNEVKIGVILPESSLYPWSIQRVLPAINLAVEYVQNDILPGAKLELLVEDSDCSGTKASLAAFELHQKEVHVLLGPVCNYAALPVARFSTIWNIPIITAGASATDFDTKNDFKLLTRIQETKTLTAESVVHFTEVFNWTHIGLIFEENDRSANSIKSECFLTMQAIYYKWKTRYGIAPHYQTFNKTSNFEDILRSASSEATVFIVCGQPDSTRELMIKTHKLGMNRGDNVFINIHLEKSEHSDLDIRVPWYRKSETDEQNNRARKAYETLLTISVREPPSMEYNIFSNEVKKRTNRMFPNINYGEETVNNFVGAFHDAVVLYALALNETIDAGEPISNGTAITHRMWDRTFNGITGTVAIDTNGDRLMDYSLLDMDPHTGQYQVVANYYGKSKQVEFVPGTQIHFGADNDEPPSGNPPCGLDNSKCATKDTKQNKSDKQQEISEMLEALQTSFVKVTTAVEEHRIKLRAITKLIDEE